MNKITSVTVMCFFLIFPYTPKAEGQDQKRGLVFIRHAEKSDDGSHLNCRGINRSLLLPALLYRKFGRPEAVYVPRLKQGTATKHLRMLETIRPFLIKYDLRLNTAFDVDDLHGLATSLYRENGTVFIVWEYHRIPAIVRCLGVGSAAGEWNDKDFDSIWIVDFVKGKAVLSKDREQLDPAAGCAF